MERLRNSQLESETWQHIQAFRQMLEKEVSKGRSLPKVALELHSDYLMYEIEISEAMRQLAIELQIDQIWLKQELIAYAKKGNRAAFRLLQPYKSAREFWRPKGRI